MHTLSIFYEKKINIWRTSSLSLSSNNSTKARSTYYGEPHYIAYMSPSALLFMFYYLRTHHDVNSWPKYSLLPTLNSIGAQIFNTSFPNPKVPFIHTDNPIANKTRHPIIVKCKVENPPRSSRLQDPDFCVLLPPSSRSDGGGASKGVKLTPPSGGAGRGDGNNGAGFELLEQVGKGSVLVLWFSGIIVASTTPSMPWHLMEDPAVHTLGLTIRTLFR